MRAVPRRHRITVDLTTTATTSAPSGNSSTTTTASAASTTHSRPLTKWMFSWRRLRTCLLQPYSHRRPNDGSDISTNTEESVSCPSASRHQHNQHAPAAVQELPKEAALPFLTDQPHDRCTDETTTQQLSIESSLVESTVTKETREPAEKDEEVDVDAYPVHRMVKEPPAIESSPPLDSLLNSELVAPPPPPQVQVTSSALSSLDYPSTCRRGSSVPLARNKDEASPVASSLCSSAPPKLPPTSANTRLPPKAPIRPQLMGRRVSSTAGGIGNLATATNSSGGGGLVRPRLDSTVTTGTNSSRHRRQNNSFEFSVDSLHMINQENADPTTLTPGRQASENSWATLPLASIQIGVLQRDFSELMTEDINDDYYAKLDEDSLVMSSDEEGGNCEKDEAETSSPSPTSVIVESSVQQAEAQQLPDWMLQWAQQPSTNYLSEGDGEEEQSVSRSPTPVHDEPTYLPSGPKPEGCRFSAYMAVSLGEKCKASLSNDDTDSVHLVQVIGNKLVMDIGLSSSQEMPLNRETRIQPQTLEDDPRRVVVVRYQAQEWKLFPIALIPMGDGTFRRLPVVSKPLVVSSDQHEDDEGEASQASYCRSLDQEFDDDSQQCEAVLHLMFLLDSCCRQQVQQ